MARKTTAKFGADNSDFKKGVSQMSKALDDLNKKIIENQAAQKEANSTINAAQKEIKSIEKDIKDSGEATEDQKKHIDELNKVIDEERSKLAHLKTEQSALRTEMKNVSKETENTKKKTDELKKSSNELEKALSDATGKLKDSLDDVKSSGAAFEALAQKLKEIGMSIIAIGQQFTASMSEVGAISGATAEQMELLEKTAREYGATTRFSASEAAQALKYMALAGWDANQSVESLGSVLALAAAGNMDLARASDIVTDYITAFGLSANDAAHFSDVMSYAMSNSNTNVEQLGEAYKNCASTAASMGYSLEEVTAVLMTMANAGVKGGEAGTTLNAIMTRLATDTKGCATQLHEMGIEIYDDNDNLKSLSEILELVSGAFNGLSDKSDASLAKIIAGQNQYAGFQTILKGLSESAKEGGQSFADYANALEKCDGTSKVMAKTMSDNLSGDIKTMQSAFEELAIKIFEDGEQPLRNFVKSITNEGIPNLEKLIENLDKLIPVIVSAGAAFTAYKAGMAIGNLVGSLITAFGALRTAIDAAKLSQLELNAVMSANPIGVVLGLLSALTVGLIAYKAATDTAKKGTDAFTAATQRALKAVEDFDKATQTAKDNYAETISNAEAEAALIDKLKDSYDRLKNETHLTAGEQAEFNIIAEELAEKLGITTDDLKDQNGQWADITEKIKQHNQALKDNAELQAKQELYKDAIKERTKAEIELKEAEKARVDYYHENKEKIDNAFKEGYNIYDNAEYQEFQRMASAADELSKRLEETKKFEEETAEEIDKTTKKLSTSSSAAANYADDIDDINDSLGELDSTLEDVENKLTQENEKLLNNQQQIKKLREDLKDYQKQLKDADPTSDEYRTIQENIRATTEMIAYLQTKQVGIRQNIADLKNTIKDLSKNTDDAIGDTLSELQSLSSLIEKMKFEVEDGGSLTLSTLQNIMSKYPQLTDDVNDYIKGLKTESNLMRSLEKIYNDDVDAYNSAVSLKKIATEGLTADCSEAVKKLVNKYNEQYGIDIRNFADATAAKAAAHQKLMNEMTAAETEYRKIADENNYIVYQNAYGRSVYAKNAYGSLRQVTGAELSAYDKRRQRYFDAQKAVNAFGDGSDFAKALSDDLVRLYGGTDADALKRLTGSNGSGGSSTSKNNTWSMTALGVYGSGNSAVAAELQWLDRVTALGKINEQQQKKYLDNWVTDTKLTADERYEIEKRLYDLNKKLSEKAQTEREQAAQDEQKKRLERLEYASAAYQKLVKGQISAYEANSDKIKSDLNSQIAALDDQLAKRKQQQEDDSRQDELNQLNLRLKYAQLSETERNLLEKQRESLIKQQQEVEFERNIENQKTELQKKANDQIARNTSAIERLNLAIEDAVYYFAKLSGSQTVSQIVNNSTSNQTTNYIRAGLTEAEANRLLRSIY